MDRIKVIAVAIVSVAASIGAALLAAFGIQRRRRGQVERRLAVLAPYLVRAGVPAEEVASLALLGPWQPVETGGDVSSGNFDGAGLCPCQHEYTVASVLVPLPGGRPAKAAIPGLLNFAPPRAPDWTCPDDCIQVMTHRWRGWQLQTDGQAWQIWCWQFAQYHCKKPDDPARDAPPIEGPPKPEA
jgi:hypothetical protein